MGRSVFNSARYFAEGCPLCRREGAPRERHHLTPRQKGGQNTASICCDCHSAIHRAYTNAEIVQLVPTLGDIMRDAKILPMIEFIRKQPVTKRIIFAQSVSRNQKEPPGWDDPEPVSTSL